MKCRTRANDSRSQNDNAMPFQPVRKEIVRIGLDLNDEATDFLNRNCPVDQNARIETMTRMSSSKQQYQYMLLRRPDTPGLGKEMERISIRDCKAIAEKGNFGFCARRIEKVLR
jgi:hypothetical protein